ncbi:MAG: ABC transporter permease [Chromatiales bacterium]|nr:ABC transporter permease [Chromatiales bacterium]
MSRHKSTSMGAAARAWHRFKSNRRGYISLWILAILFGISLFAEVISNDKPLIVSYQGELYFPLLKNYPETHFGGDFVTETDYLDPFIREQLMTGENWALYPLNPYNFNTINYFARSPNPAAPSDQNFFGTDDRGRDVLARLIYGFRISVIFAFAVTAMIVVLGMMIGAIQGYFGGRIDLVGQRISEIWSSMPKLYLLIILASIFHPSLGLLILLLTVFGWMGMADYVRAEFLKGRNMDYVLSARALGLSNGAIMRRHIMPNAMTPVITFLPFELSGAILALTSLDFLGLGVPPSTPSIGELLAQGKENLDAWWLSLSAFLVLVGLLMLLSFIGEALREAMDTRKG